MCKIEKIVPGSFCYVINTIICKNDIEICKSFTWLCRKYESTSLTPLWCHSWFWWDFHPIRMFWCDTTYINLMRRQVRAPYMKASPHLTPLQILALVEWGLRRCLQIVHTQVMLKPVIGRSYTTGLEENQ